MDINLQALTTKTDEKILENRIARTVNGKHSRDEAGSRRAKSKPSGEKFRLGWQGWLAIEIVTVFLLFVLIFAYQPLVACNQQEQATGFYAGDTFGKCLRRGMDQRADRVEHALRDFFRNPWR